MVKNVILASNITWPWTLPDMKKWCKIWKQRHCPILKDCFSFSRLDFNLESWECSNLWLNLTTCDWPAPYKDPQRNDKGFQGFSFSLQRKSQVQPPERMDTSLLHNPSATVYLIPLTKCVGPGICVCFHALWLTCEAPFTWEPCIICHMVTVEWMCSVLHEIYGTDVTLSYSLVTNINDNLFN